MMEVPVASQFDVEAAKQAAEKLAATEAFCSGGVPTAERRSGTAATIPPTLRSARECSAVL